MTGTGVMQRLGVLTAFSVALHVGADDAEQLATLLDRMATLRAEFEQTVTSRFGDVLQTATGRMHLERPARLRWEVDEPYPQLVVTNGETLWVFDPDLEQVAVQPLAEALSGSPTVFLTATVQELRRDYSVRATETDATGGSRFELTPLDSNAVFSELVLTFGTNGTLAGIDIADHLAQFTRVTFRAADLNPVLDSALFEFEVPVGIDVIGDVSGERDG